MTPRSLGFWGPNMDRLIEEMARRGKYNGAMSPAQFAQAVREELGATYDELPGVDDPEVFAGKALKKISL